MIGLAQRRGQPQTSGYPVHLLDVELAQQNTGAGTTFLRWRKHDRSAMGVALWQALMASAATPVTMLDDLHAFERQRIVINMQITMRCRSKRSEEHTSELQSLMRISYAVFCLKKKK